MIKLIASDLDGTLLQDHEQELSSHTLSLIRQISKKGVHFIAASGRQYDNLTQVFEAIHDDISYIAENGSICMHQGNVISRTTIAPELCKKIIDEVKRDNRFELVISQQQSCFIEDRNPDYVHLIKDVMKNTTEVVRDLRTVTGPILKIAICNMTEPDEDFMDYLHTLRDLFKDQIKIVTSGNIWIDFIAPGSNKGTALSAFMDLFHVTPDECMVFGDQYNDLEMLQSAKHSYAMKTCAPGVEKYAAYQTERVEDILEKLLEDL